MVCRTHNFSLAKVFNYFLLIPFCLKQKLQDLKDFTETASTTLRSSAVCKTHYSWDSLLLYIIFAGQPIYGTLFKLPSFH